MRYKIAVPEVVRGNTQNSQSIPGLPSRRKKDADREVRRRKEEV